MSIDIGNLQRQPQGFSAFVPSTFPPSGGIVLSPELAKKHAEAARLVGKLDGITQLLPDKDFFLLMFIRKDASSSSQIEGTQATMMDAIEAESKERAQDLPADVDDILHYVRALNFGLKRIVEFPLSLRLIKELHGVLMTDARTTHNAFPGEFRVSQNWIGGTAPSNARFVPPPVHEMNRALTDLEKFMRDDDFYMPLVKAGLLHAQFETIHPFNDGNGRTGRMLVTMYMWHLKQLEVPVLYLSYYFKKHQQVYYERLDTYHATPAKVEEWLDFFLDGVIETAESAIATCHKVTKLRDRDMAKAHELGRTAADNTTKMIKKLYSQPVVSVADVVAWTDYTRPGAYKVIERLVDLDILKPLKTATKYGQKYLYADYYDIFKDEENTEAVTSERRAA